MLHPLAYIDIETTGLNVYYDNVIEIGVILGNIERSWLIKIQGTLSVFIRDLTGLGDDDLQTQGVPIHQALTEMMEFITSEGMPILVGHNILGFDRRFILEEMRDAELTELYTQFSDLMCIDTLYLSQLMIPSGSHNLASTCKHLEIEVTGAHRSLADCRMVRDVIRSMYDKYPVDYMIRSSIHQYCSDGQLDSIVESILASSI
jgi:DNA polymerase III alpha subunit (gram-positive type)